MSASVDASGFFNLVAGLSEISGKTFQDVLIDQIAALMKVCIRLTHSPTNRTIERRVAFRNRSVSVKGGAKLSITKDGERVWLVDDEKEYLVSTNHVPGPVWAKFLILSKALEQNRLDPSVAKKSRGFQKKTWYQIAEALGVGEKVGAPVGVRNATQFRGGQAPTVGTVQTIVDDASLYIEVRNASKLLRVGAGRNFRGNRDSLDGMKILQGAMRIRESAFRSDLQKGVFDDISTRAKRYPGIFTNASA